MGRLRLLIYQPARKSPCRIWNSYFRGCDAGTWWLAFIEEPELETVESNPAHKVDYYLKQKNRRITFEYILLKDVNDHPKEARELAKLLHKFRHLAYVNLIPYNPVDEHIQYERSDTEDIQMFHKILQDKGINSGVRYEQGADIDAACGQLRSKQMKKNA